MTENCQGNLGTYYTDALSKNGAGRKAVQDVHNTLEGSHELAILSSKFTEGLRFLLKSLSDRLDIIAALEFGRKRVFYKVYSCLFFILVQSTLKK